MSRLRLRTIADAPDDAKESLTAVEKRNGFLPNLLGVLANAPVALETYLTVSAINNRGSLTLAQRETVQITAAATHGCAFCVAGHTAIAYNKANLQPLPDENLDAVAQFTKAVIATRGRVEDRDLEAFHAAGFDDAAALEVVLGVSLATLCNFANNLGQPPLNEQLEKFRWSATESVSA
jgi:alkylhydroperoxidase family enzyme